MATGLCGLPRCEKDEFSVWVGLIQEGFVAEVHFRGNGYE